VKTTVKTTVNNNSEQQPNENESENPAQPSETPSETPSENNNSNEQQPPAQPESYLYSASHPNINSLIYTAGVFNQGIWESEDGEVFEFYNGWDFKYWKNGVLIYTGDLMYYGISHNDYINFYVVGKVNGEIVIFTKITNDRNGTGIICIGDSKEFIKYNYLMPDRNINLKNYRSSTPNANFSGIWINRDGEMFQFANGAVKYWDSSNKGGEKMYMSVLYKAEPTFEGGLKYYWTLPDTYDYFVVLEKNDSSNILIFTPYEFRIVDTSINGGYRDLYINGVQFVQLVYRDRAPVFKD
jgi:hypothetical protein